MSTRFVKSLDLDSCSVGEITNLKVETVGDALAADIHVPVIVARGAEDGPVFGISAAVHGNELNGIPAIHRLLQEIELHELRGTIMAVPVVNVPGYLRNQRVFNDGNDLNRIFPGKEGGTNSQVFTHRLLERIFDHMDFLVDLHTASFGRVNSLYVRGDLHHPVSTRMARAFGPQILLHNRGAEGTLRDAMMDLGKPAITIEIGNPQRIQDDLVWWSVGGIRRILDALDIYDNDGQHPRPEKDPIVCGRSYWTYTDRGGVLEVFPKLTDRLKAGERIATVRDIFGNVIREYFAPEAGIVIGYSTNPVNQTGSRIVHLGVVGEPEQAPTAPDE